MKYYKFLLAILIIPFQSFAQNNSNSWPGKEKVALVGAIKSRVSLYAEVLDIYEKDKVITEFLLTDFKADSIIEDQVHNEGDAFLFHPTKNGFTLTLIEKVANEKEKKSTLKQLQIEILNKKLKVSKKSIPLGPIVTYLKKFKKYQKIK